MKGIVIVLLLIGGLITVIARSIKRGLSNSNINDLFAKAKKNADFAASLALGIDFLYKTKEAIQCDLQALHKQLLNKKVGKFFIKDAILSQSFLLLFTECNYQEWDTNWRGRSDDIDKTKLQLWVIRNEENKVGLYGELFANNVEKHNNEDFISFLMSLM
jgi:hypothetical protein